MCANDVRAQPSTAPNQPRPGSRKTLGCLAVFLLVVVLPLAIGFHCLREMRNLSRAASCANDVTMLYFGLRRYAAEINLDIETFNNCLDSNLHQNTVTYDLEAARELRLLGTPSFLVNGQPFFGVNPQPLIQAIDTALAGK